MSALTPTASATPSTPVPQSAEAKLLAEIQAAAFPEPEVPSVIEFRQSKEGKQLVQWAQEKFSKCKNLREREERQWNTNYAFYSGNQWIKQLNAQVAALQGSGAGLAVLAKSKGKEQLIINRIKAVCRTEMSKFLSKKPGASVVPATADDADQAAAEAAEQIWESISQRKKLERTLSQTIFWMVVTGTGFTKVYWDDEVLDSDAQVMGDVVYGAVDPYKLFFPDLNCWDISDQPYMFHAYARPTEELKIRYAAELEGITLKPTCKESDTILQAAFANPRAHEKKEFDSNMVYELWIKPGVSELIPNGGRIVLIEDTMVAADIEGIPYEHGEFPFAMFKHIPTGRFYGSSVIEELIGLQKEYNELRSTIKEAGNKMGKPQLVAPKGAVSASRITNEIGLLIEYKLGTAPPQPMTVGTLPPYMLEQQDRILADIEDISGQHQVTKGSVPPGLTAASAISYLQEADDSFLFTSYANVEDAYEVIARQTLQLVAQYWDAPRLVKVSGDTQAFNVGMYSGADIRNGLDIRIEKGSALPQSKAAKQAFIMDMMVNQFIPVEDGLERLEMGGASSILDTIQIDRRQAKRENVKFRMLTDADFAQYDMLWQQKLAELSPDATTADGQILQQPPIIPVNDFDNHEVHIEEHNKFRRSQAYDMLTPAAKEAMQTHVEMHTAMMYANQLEQMLSMVPSDGSAPGVDGTVPPEEMDAEGMTPPTEMDLAGTPADNMSTAEPSPMEGA